MTLMILIALSFVMTFAALVYLLFKDLKGEKFGEKVKNAVKKNIWLIVYLALCFCVSIGLSIVLEKVYIANTLISNMKVITLFCLLETVAVTDMREHIIPNKIILAGVFFRVCYAVAELLTLEGAYFDILKGDLYSIGLVVVLFILGVLVIKNGIGMGDIKLIFVMGIFQGITGIISSLFMSLVASFFVAVAMLIAKKKTRKDAMAFAPSVLVGTAVSMFLTGM